MAISTRRGMYGVLSTQYKVRPDSVVFGD